MPMLSLDVSHALSPDEVVRRLKEKFAAARAEYQDRVSNFREEWRDHTVSFGFRALGMAVSGTVAVEAEKVRLDATLPFAAICFKSTIEDHIRREVGGLLAADNTTNDTDRRGNDRS
jgi:hypothetical protein